jgi:hypothetical protein
VAQSHVFAGVGGYYGGNEGNLAGVFRRKADSAEWTHVLTEPEAYTVFVHPRDPSLVLAGTKDGIYRSTDGGASFKRANFPDSGVQIWSFLADPADTKQILAGGSPVSIYRSNDGGANWARQNRSEAAGSGQGAVRGPGHAFCPASRPAERNLCRS